MNLQTLKNRNGEKGFTIVELLIVIVVIAILAAISIVYTVIQNRARESAAQSLASQIAKKADSYYAINSSYPVSAANFGAENESRLEGLKVTISSGAAPTSVAAAQFGTGTTATNALNQYNSGSRVIYNATANGYVVTYRTGAGGVATISKGTAPTGTYTFGTNENL